MRSWRSFVVLIYVFCVHALIVVDSANGAEWRSNTLSGTLSRSFIIELDYRVVSLDEFRQFDVKNRKPSLEMPNPSLSSSNASIDFMPWGYPSGLVLPHHERRDVFNNHTMFSLNLEAYNQHHDRRGLWDARHQKAARRITRRDGEPQQYVGPIYFAIRQEFPNKRLFFGLSVTLEHAYDLSMLRHMRGVKSVTPISFVRRPMPYGNKVQLVSKPSQHQLVECKNNLAMTGVDKLHAMGIDGRTSKVAIIDTGVDWTHPALGGCFGKGCRISFGFDFVGDDYDGANDPMPDADPLSQCGPHGTHVTGIIGALDSKYKLTGVAPGAQLGMYRVFGCQGGTADDLLMKAMEAAFEDGADIVSISVGAPAGWTETPTARMASNIAKEGRIMVVASGNDGAVVLRSEGMSLQLAASIALCSLPYYAPRAFRLPAMPVYATAADATAPRDACDPLPEYVPDLSPYAVLVRRGGCSLDVKFRHVAESGGKMILLWNSALPPIYLEAGYGIANAAVIGAADGAWILDQLQSGNNVRLAFPDSGPTTVANNFTGGTVSPFSSYGPTFDLLPPTDVSAPGGLILSTWPVNLGNYSILSGTSMSAPFTAGAAALLLQAQRQGRLGTNVPLTPKDIIERLRSTALPASNSTKGVFLETVAKQGSGLLQIDKAVLYTTVVSPTRLMLNDTRTFKRRHTFNITNGSPETLTYVIEHEAAGTALTFPYQRYNYQNLGPVPMVATAASVMISPRQLALDPSETFTVTLNFTLPTGRDVDPGLFPVFSGFLRISSSGNETLTVSYMGLGADLSTIKMLDDKSGMSKNYALPAVLIGDTGKVQRLPRMYSFKDGDLPLLQFRLVAGSRLTRIDIIENVAQARPGDVPFAGSVVDQDVPAPNPPEVETLTDPPVPVPTDPNDVLAPFTRRAARVATAAPAAATTTSFGRSGILGRLMPPSRRTTASDSMRNINASRVVGPITSAALLPRNSFDQSYGIYAVIWDGTVAGIGRVQPGDYKILLRTLRIGAQASDDDMQSETASQEQDPNDSGEKRWEEWLSPVIRVPSQ
ncbi:unnamed protein product [Tilletia laevis]|uniref:Peptidase S8/S53 domain-containing protein n=2 Tax=Tilletia TaxID=13289 RepID=A0A9N8Q6V2_9BASI|nr:unnamed protein product [Tilletia caries]CAD6896343.1 unnamed protein product [Tilletia laevis]CAD6905491.1 unnamed protein product [Tilletia caries]CAD6927912.1 unnamed protein product [Tilletia caries]CAD6957705.1 unnamed protein product [Tilletia laevis]